MVTSSVLSSWADEGKMRLRRSRAQALHRHSLAWHRSVMYARLQALEDPHRKQWLRYLPQHGSACLLITQRSHHFGDRAPECESFKRSLSGSGKTVNRISALSRQLHTAHELGMPVKAVCGWQVAQGSLSSPFRTQGGLTHVSGEPSAGKAPKALKPQADRRCRRRGSASQDSTDPRSAEYGRVLRTHGGRCNKSDILRKHWCPSQQELRR